MDELIWPDGPNVPPESGWIGVLTPLGAGVHVRVNSAAWDLCTEWQLLQSGRGLLSPTDPLEWFDAGELLRAPQGLVAELLASGMRMQDFTRLVAENVEARRPTPHSVTHIGWGRPGSSVAWLAASLFATPSSCTESRPSCASPPAWKTQAQQTSCDSKNYSVRSANRLG